MRYLGMKYPSFSEEKKLWRKGYKNIACLDEAGRGALCGPVVAGAVMIKNPKSKIQIPNKSSKSKYQIPKHILGLNHWDLFRNSDLGFRAFKIRDSKKLSAKQRETLYKVLTKNKAIRWGIGIVSEKMIDKINVKNAAELAMEKALVKIQNSKIKNQNYKSKLKIDFLIIDGNHINNLNLKTYNLKLIVKADEKVFSCAAASILAKVTRDRLMVRYHEKYPRYRFDLHKGYGTKVHLKMLKKYGPCKIHRKSFEPVRACKIK